MHQAAATPQTVFSGTLIAATSSVSSDRGQRVRLGQGVQHAAEATQQRLGEHHDQRQQQQYHQQHDSQPSQSRMLRSPVPSSAAADWLIAARTPMRRCSRLSSSRMAKDTSSMTRPSAAAPA